MDKYDVMRYALNNANKLPPAKKVRPKPAAPRAAPERVASRLSTAGPSVASRALGGASLMGYSRSVGAGSDRPMGSNGGLGMTKAETASGLAAARAARKTIPMSPERPDSLTNKRVNTKASGNVRSPEAEAKRIGTKASGNATSGRKSFGAAFKSARKAGKKTFTWAGKSYTTKVK